ncbi:N-lysine methyltransferase mettl21a [Thalictrum thalictroides]|uniref:N-lysine methyltransferase mettl21a n=1 Tax=Thalictrum thalictroides TaxID=46969 RepID=A0A7J6UW36_THATH|nr:N-lysine methyltransferase mettl21a [Thalictrum thalictroides]
MANQVDEDDVDADYLFPIIHQETAHILEEAAQEEQELQHYLPSIDSTVVIRQLPSQGLSFKIWAAANTLVALLEQYHQHPNNSPLSSVFNCHNNPFSILELGSGTGLVGIAAAAILRAKVTITDLPNVLPNLSFNAMANSATLVLNGGNVDVSSLRWGEVDDMESIGKDFNMILGSDVVYHDNLYEPLLKTLQFFLGGKSNTVFVMAHLRRWKKESAFFKKARKLFQIQVLHSDSPLPGARVGVVVYSFSRKGANAEVVTNGTISSV